MPSLPTKYNYELENGKADILSIFPAPIPAKPAAYIKPLRNTWQGPTTCHKQQQSEKQFEKQSRTGHGRDPGKEESSQRERSRSPAKSIQVRPPSPKQGSQEQSAPSQAASVGRTFDRVPSNSDEAKQQGWKQVDLKGTGDCMYRALAAARAYMKENNTINEDQAQKAGAEMRLIFFLQCAQVARSPSQNG